MRENLPHQYLDLALFEQNYDLLEKSQLLCWLLQRRGISRQEVIQKYMPQLACEPHETVLDYHLELLNLEKTLAHWVIEFELPIKIGVRLSRLSKGDQKALARLPVKLSMNGNQFKNIFENLEELSVKEKKEISCLVDEFSRLENFEKALFERRYPRLKVAQYTWNSKKKKISLPGGVRLKDPITFEESSIQVEMKVRSAEDLKNKLAQLSILTHNKDFDELLDLL